MGDPRRFHAFSEIISQNIPNNFNIADIAGGKGYLQAALRQRGFPNITSWDKRKKMAANRKGYRYGFFDFQTAPKYEAVVAMHPDEGTDHAILYAAVNRVPAIICPCCTKPSACAYWGNHKYECWLNHLITLAEKNNLKVKHEKLKINGRNDVLIITPENIS